MLANTLARGLDALAIDLDSAAQQKLLDYLALLKRWNASYNLTAIRDEEAMVVRHLLDSLSVLPFVDGQHCVDVGTGAGLPGLPLAVALPEKQFTLLDSNGKKTRFLTQAIAQLGLDNARMLKSRVEDYLPEPRFDVVLSRAFASLDAMITGCHQLLCPGGLFLAMKGQLPEHELHDIPAGAELLGVERLTVPGLAEDRCLVRLRAR